MLKGELVLTSFLNLYSCFSYADVSFRIEDSSDLLNYLCYYFWNQSNHQKELNSFYEYFPVRNVTVTDR
jgi:hypothetical protein